jgi:uncharacterized membrane protein
VDVEYETVVDIAASPDRVWEVLADVTGWSRWTDSVTESTVLDDGPLAVGSRVKVRQPRMAANTWRITDWEPGRRFTWEASSGGVHTVADHVIDSEAGSSRVTLSLRTNGLLAPVVDLLMGSRIRRYVGMEAAGLKIESERIA